MFQSLPQANLEILVLVDPALMEMERKTAPEAGRYDQRIKGQKTAKAVMKLRWTLFSQMTPLRPTSNVAAQDLTSQFYLTLANPATDSQSEFTRRQAGLVLGPCRIKYLYLYVLYLAVERQPGMYGKVLKHFCASLFIVKGKVLVSPRRPSSLSITPAVP